MERLMDLRGVIADKTKPYWRKAGGDNGWKGRTRTRATSKEELDQEMDEYWAAARKK